MIWVWTGCMSFLEWTYEVGVASLFLKIFLTAFLTYNSPIYNSFKVTNSIVYSTLTDNGWHLKPWEWDQWETEYIREDAFQTIQCYLRADEEEPQGLRIGQWGGGRAKIVWCLEVTQRMTTMLSAAYRLLFLFNIKWQFFRFKVFQNTYLQAK